MKIKLNDGEIINVVCQQYEVGLYVCIYGENGLMKDQFGLDVSKEEFIKQVKNNEVFEGTFIE